MELREFIGQALGEIIEGVRDAQKAVDGRFGAAVVDRELTYELGAADPGGLSPRQTVRFHIALTSTDSEGGKGGLGVFLGGLAIGGQVKSDAEHVSLTRLEFSIPIQLPQQPTEEELEEMDRQG